MKKILTIILALGLVASFTACGNNEQVGSGEQNNNNSQASGTVLTIEGNPSTGYAWYASGYDSNIIKVEELGTDGEANSELVGAPVDFKFNIVGLNEGISTLTFNYYRSFEGIESTIDTVEYMVTVDELLNVVAEERVPEPPMEEDEFTPSAEMQGIIDDLVAKSGVEFRMPATSKILVANAQNFVGLSEDTFTKYVVDSAVYEPMISPATSSLCVIKLSEDADVASLKQTVISDCNPAKWVCMSAEKCLAMDSGRYIMLIMSTPEDCDAMKKAFTEHFGAENVGDAVMKDGISEDYELPSEMLAE